jgi:hypothetical protein
VKGCRVCRIDRCDDVEDVAIDAPGNLLIPAKNLIFARAVTETTVSITGGRADR